MAIEDNNRRFEELYAWMNHAERQITFLAIAEQLDIAESTARKHLKSETIPTSHYRKLIALGFPPELLPRAEDKVPGRKRKVPRFPGLQAFEACPMM